MSRRESGHCACTWQVTELIYALFWGLVCIAKAIALMLLLTAADTHWRDALAWLAFAFGLVALAVAWRTHRTRGAC